jgi:hypothetical protein
MISLSLHHQTSIELSVHKLTKGTSSSSLRASRFTALPLLLVGARAARGISSSELSSSSITDLDRACVGSGVCSADLGPALMDPKLRGKGCGEVQ